MPHTNIVQKLRDKKSFTYMAYMVLKSKLFSSGILFISSIIIIRAIPKDDYGLYVLVMIFFGFFELLLGGLDHSITRFVPKVGKIEQHKIISTVIFIKTIIVILILFSLLFLYGFSKEILNIPIEKYSTYEKLYYITTLSFIFKYLTTTALRIINSYMLYGVLLKLTILNSSATLIICIIISLFDLNIWQYASAMVGFAFVYSIISIYAVSAQKKISLSALQSFMNINTVRITARKQIIPYSLPLFGVGVLSFVKNNLPGYLFGAMVSLEMLATYNIFKKLTGFLHKGYDGFIQSLYPKLFSLIDSKSRAIEKFFKLGFLVRLSVFIVLYFSYSEILDMYKIKEEEYDFVIFLVLISSFLILYFGSFFNLIIMSKFRTFQIFKSSILRNLSFLFFSYFLFSIYGTIGLIVAIFLDGIITSNILYYYFCKVIDNRMYFFIYYGTIILLTSALVPIIYLL